MTDESDKADLLEAHFAVAKAGTKRPGDDLMARILTDADAVQAARAAGTMRPAALRGGWFGVLLRGIGGWPAVGALATATVAGLWLGMNPPSGLLVAAESVLGVETGGEYLIDLDPEATFQIAEGAL